MTLKLSTTNTAPYDDISEGDGSNPVTVTGVLDGSGGTADSSIAALYLVATDYHYTGIAVTVTGEQTGTGINWQLSADDGATWEESLDSTDLPAMNALVADQSKTILAKAVLTNDGGGDQPATGIYTAPDISITATENPE